MKREDEIDMIVEEDKKSLRDCWSGLLDSKEEQLITGGDDAVLREALALFEISKLSYCKTNWQDFEFLVKLLSNKLCFTIYTSMYRSFCDYASFSEPLSENSVRDLLATLKAFSTDEEQISYFFNFFLKFKQLPLSQKYPYYEIEDLKIRLEEFIIPQFCLDQIQYINTEEDRILFEKWIGGLIESGPIALFEALKFEAATIMETENYYLKLPYAELMQTIKNCFLNITLDSQTYQGILAKMPSFEQASGQSSAALVSQIGFLRTSPLQKSTEVTNEMDLSFT